MKQIHKLTNINKLDKIANCSICGEVPIKWTPAMKYPACRNRIRKNYAEYKFNKRYGNRRSEEYTLELKQCEICLEEKKMVYDHNHSTNTFRGYICSQCNLMLGWSYDNPKTLERGAKYLRRFLFNNLSDGQG